MIGSNPLVSVLIPSYNHERFVEQTIRSIMGQTYDNIELVIIDDGSTDATWSKIRALLPECQKRFVRVYAKTRPNIGSALTSNELISEAKGKYIYSIASDDLSKPQAVEKQVDFLEKQDANIGRLVEWNYCTRRLQRLHGRGTQDRHLCGRGWRAKKIIFEKSHRC